MSRGRAEDGEWAIDLDRELSPHLLAHNRLAIGGRVGAPEELESVLLRHGSGELPAALDGDRFELVVDTSTWPRGEHALAVEARWHGGSTASARGTVEVQPFAPPPSNEAAILAEVAAGRAAMWCEVPDFGAGEELAPGPVEVRGWAIAPGGISRVLVTVDGIPAVALQGLPRPDLRDGFGDDLAADCGFGLRLGPDELLPGRHEVAVVAIAVDGSAQGMSGIVTVTPPEPQPIVTGRPPEPLPARFPPVAPAGDRPADLFAAPLAQTLRRQAAYALVAGLGIEGRALDVGCGGGTGTALLARSATATGFDASPLRIADAQARFGDRARFLSGEMTELPFATDSFDLVVGLAALGHVADPAALLEEMCRVLAPNGVLAIGLDPRPVGAPFRTLPVDAEPVRARLGERFARVEELAPRLWLTVAAGEADGSALLDCGEGKSEEGPSLLLAGPPSLALPSVAPRVEVGTIEDEQRQLTELWRERSVAGELKMATLRTDVHYLNTAHRIGLERAAERAETAAAEAAALRAANAELLGSSSWRLTRPLRRLARALRRS